MTDRLEDSYLIDVVVHDIKAQLKEMLPKLEGFPSSLAGNDGEDSNKSIELTLEKGIPTPLQFVADAIQKRTQGILNLSAVEEYDNLIDHVARAAFDRSGCLTDYGWIIEDLGWTQSGISCYPCDHINEVGEKAVAQELFDRLIDDPEKLASITGEGNAATIRHVLSRGQYVPEVIQHKAGRGITALVRGLMTQYDGTDGRFIRASTPDKRTGRNGREIVQSIQGLNYYWEPAKAEQTSTN